MELIWTEHGIQILRWRIVAEGVSTVLHRLSGTDTDRIREADLDIKAGLPITTTSSCMITRHHPSHQAESCIICFIPILRRDYPLHTICCTVISTSVLIHIHRVFSRLRSGYISPSSTRDNTGQLIEAVHYRTTLIVVDHSFGAGQIVELGNSRTPGILCKTGQILEKE